MRNEILAQKLELAKGTERKKDLKQVIDMAKLRHTTSKVEIKARERDLKEGRRNNFLRRERRSFHAGCGVEVSRQEVVSKMSGCHFSVSKVLILHSCQHCLGRGLHLLAAVWRWRLPPRIVVFLRFRWLPPGPFHWDAVATVACTATPPYFRLPFVLFIIRFEVSARVKTQ